MGSIVIVDSYSHMFGEEVLRRRHRDLYNELIRAFQTTPVTRTKISEEKRRYGQLIFSGTDFNSPLKNTLHENGWEARRVIYPGQSEYSFEVDFCKGKVGLEIQFGKYFAVQKDLYNLLYLFGLGEERRIDVGVIAVPSDELHFKMPSGVGKFSSIITAINSHARNDPPFPALILALDVAE